MEGQWSERQRYGKYIKEEKESTMNKRERERKKGKEKIMTGMERHGTTEGKDIRTLEERERMHGKRSGAEEGGAMKKKAYTREELHEERERGRTRGVQRGRNHKEM